MRRNKRLLLVFAVLVAGVIIFIGSNDKNPAVSFTRLVSDRVLGRKFDIPRGYCDIPYLEVCKANTRPALNVKKIQ